MRLTILAIAAAAAAACGSVGGGNPDGGGDDGGIDAMYDASLIPAGSIRWARSMSAASPTGIVEGAGGLAVVGYFTTVCDLGGEVMTSRGQSDSVVAGFSPDDAAHIYSYQLGGTGSEFAFLDTADGQGAPLVAGVAYGDTAAVYDLGQGPMTGGGGPGSDGFIGRYSPTGPNWVKRAVGPGEDKLVDTAVGPSSVFAIGWYETMTTVDTATHLAQGGREILFTRWNTFTGALEQSRSFGSPDRDEANSIAALPGGDVVAAGYFAGTLDLGVGAMTSADSLDVWVARFTPDGSPVWSARFGGIGEDRGPQLAVDAAGDIYMAGVFSTQAAFGAVNLTSQGMFDIFVTKLSPANGAVMWATAFGTGGVENATDIAVDGDGHVFVGANVSGPLEPGGPYGGGLDAAIFSYGTATGSPRWSKSFGTPGDDRGWAVGLGVGAVYFGFSATGPVDLDDVPITGAPSPSGLVLKMAP